MRVNNLIRLMRLVFFAIIAISLHQGLASVPSRAALSGKTSADIPSGKPTATIDLATVDGVSAVKGEWRYSDTKIVEADFRGPGADRQPTGPAVKTYDYTPHAGGADFDDSTWEVIAATTLDQRRGNGRL